jgi:hypothetical protein
MEGWLDWTTKIEEKSPVVGRDCGTLSRPNEVNVADVLLHQAEAAPRKAAAGNENARGLIELKELSLDRRDEEQQKWPE